MVEQHQDNLELEPIFANKKGFMSLVEQTSGKLTTNIKIFSYHKGLNLLIYQHWTNVWPTLKYVYELKGLKLKFPIEGIIPN